MENQKNNKGIIVLLIVIIVILSVLCILFATGTISFKSDKVNDNEVNENINDKTDNNTTEKIDIEILSLDNVNITEESPNHNMSISGTMRLSFEQDKFIAVGLSGFCIGTNGEKYMMTGPGSGIISYKDGETTFALVNTINNQTGDVLYSDGTVKKSLDVDWKNVDIKSCTVEKMIAHTSESAGKTSIIKELNFEKEFK